MRFVLRAKSIDPCGISIALFIIDIIILSVKTGERERGAHTKNADSKLRRTKR